MRALATEIFHVFLSLPVWVFVALAALAARAWRRPGSHLHRWRYALAAMAAVFYLSAIPAVANLLQARLEHWHPVPQVLASDRRDDNLIIVLTAGWLRATESGYEQKIGAAGWERTIAAVELWRLVGGRLLFTGAPSPDGKDSAAAAMARRAAEMGVPKDALMVEPASVNTHENLLFAKRLVGSPTGRVWLVTSAFHMPRSVLAAKAVGFTVVPYPCDFAAHERGTWTQMVPNNSTHAALEYVFHELAGILAYRIRGWG